ncbi:MAG: creatininase family protein [Armatimonadetes bacterium]|nr:creatininase family protein [Armatimonadota bacterium]
MTWEEVRDLDRDRAVALLPIGAVEAHGPHLPLITDVVISEAMAQEAAHLLRDRGLEPVLLPPLHYTPAPFAAGFAGTLSVSPETLTRVLTDLGRSLAAHGFSLLALANTHLDPQHLACLHDSVRRLQGSLRVVFPDLTRKPWALRLGDEFRSGACHAGRYEGSVVMARRPELVRDSIRRALPANPRSLSAAIRQGLSTFEAAGGERAYFGDPAAATAAEGEETARALGAILAEAVLEVLHAADQP